MLLWFRLHSSMSTDVEPLCVCAYWPFEYLLQIVCSSFYQFFIGLFVLLSRCKFSCFLLDIAVYVVSIFSVFSLLFHFLNVSLKEKFFNFEDVLIYPSLSFMVINYGNKKFCLPKGHKDFLLCFLPEII